MVTAKLSPTRPLLSRTAASCPSVRLRLIGVIACTLEWLTINGFSDSFATSQKPFSVMWARSIRMPMRLHSLTSRLPASVRPGPVSGLEGKAKGTPWPKMVLRLHTGPSERRPAA
ncbi:hypothetical protein D9M70_607400 [compost metagenome]